MTRAELIAQAEECARIERMLRSFFLERLNTDGLDVLPVLIDRASALRAQAEAEPEAEVGAEPIGMFVGIRNEPSGTKEFFGYLYGDAPKHKCDLYTAPPADRARELLKTLEYPTDPEDRFDSAINPGPERDELQHAYDAYKGIKR